MSLMSMILRSASTTRTQSEIKFRTVDKGIRRDGKKTFAGPKVSISAWPEMRRMSRYFATLFLLMLISRAISVTVIPFGLFFRIVLISVSSF